MGYGPRQLVTLVLWAIAMLIGHVSVMGYGPRLAHVGGL